MDFRVIPGATCQSSSKSMMKHHRGIHSSRNK